MIDTSCAGSCFTVHTTNRNMVQYEGNLLPSDKSTSLEAAVLAQRCATFPGLFGFNLDTQQARHWHRAAAGASWHCGAPPASPPRGMHPAVTRPRRRPCSWRPPGLSARFGSSRRRLQTRTSRHPALRNAAPSTQRAGPNLALALAWRLGTTQTGAQGCRPRFFFLSPLKLTRGERRRRAAGRRGAHRKPRPTRARDAP